MATAKENWSRGIISLSQSEAMNAMNLIKLKDHSTSNSMVIALASLNSKHFNHRDIAVSAHTVQMLAIQLALGWNKKNKYAYVSSTTLEENLGISVSTRKKATRALRELGYFGVIEGYINANTDESFTNCYYPLFDRASHMTFRNLIQSDYDIWTSTQPVEKLTFDEEPPPF